MTRLGLACVLALGGHILFLFLTLPGRFDDPPAIRGIHRAGVKVFLPAPEPALRSEAAVEKKQPENIVKSGEAPELQAPLPEDRQPVLPSPQLQPADRKKMIGPDPVMEQLVPRKAIPVGEEAGKKERERQAVRESVQSAGPESGSRAAAAVREAAPLYEINRPPDYPVLARRRGWEGTVLLEVDVADNGTVQSVRVHTGSSYLLLDNAALDAVRGWLFKPGIRDGRPSAMKVMVPVHFILKDKE